MNTQKIENQTFSLKDVLQHYSTENRLNKRRAIHFINKELVSPAYTRHQGSRRRYDYRNLLEFGIANELVAGLGVPVTVAVRVMLELRQRGYFLMPGQYEEVKTLRKKKLHPAELRELLRERFLLPVSSGIKYTSIIIKDGKEIRSDPDIRNPKIVNQTIIKRSLSLASPSRRPLQSYMLLRHYKDDWVFTPQRLPQAFVGAADDVDRHQRSDELEKVALLVMKHPATLVLNLFLLETRVRERFDEIHGGGSGDENDVIEEF